MRLTRFTDYSFRVLIYLAQNIESRVTISQISEAYGISRNHLMKVVSNLSRLKYIEAQRGPGGGIRLNRIPEDIRLNEIISNTEKHLQNLDASNKLAHKEFTAESRLNGFLHNASHAYLDALGHYTLADILGPMAKTIPFISLQEQAA